MFPPGNFIVSAFTFRSVIDFKLIFVYGVRYESKFISFPVDTKLFQHYLLNRLSSPSLNYFDAFAINQLTICEGCFTGPSGLFH